MKRGIYIFLLFLLAYVSAAAQTKSDSVKIHFKQGYSRLDLDLRDNRTALDRVAADVAVCLSDSGYVLRSVEVVGGASPEGGLRLNERLSRRRAAVLFGHLSARTALPDSLCVFTYLGRDWQGLLNAVEMDENVPYHDETVDLLCTIVDKCRFDASHGDKYFTRLVAFKGGAPYRYMYTRLFPELRASSLRVWFDRVRPLAVLESQPMTLKPEVSATPAHLALEMPSLPSNPPIIALPPQCDFYMSLRTNMLYDALAVPNIGAEFYLGRGWTVGADWMYGWWKTDRRHRYWRIYGGDVAVRRYFGRAAEEKPLTGHHIGVYAQVLTYDFEWGGRGYMAGEPGGDIFDRAHFGAGVEYGYSLPIARRLNIDFNIGIGYLGGKYYEYLPEDKCYVWQATRNRRWFGPTKLAVSLVWLIGRGNYNKAKGGAL